MPLILALWRQRQGNLCELQASLIYRWTSETQGSTEKLCFGEEKKRTEKKKKRLLLILFMYA